MDFSINSQTHISRTLQTQNRRWASPYSLYGLSAFLHILQTLRIGVRRLTTSTSILTATTTTTGLVARMRSVGNFDYDERDSDEEAFSIIVMITNVLLKDIARKSEFDGHLGSLIRYQLSNHVSSYSVSSPASKVSYSDHCSSIIPESLSDEAEHATYLSYQFYSGYYTTSGDNVPFQNLSFNHNSLVFRALKVHKTEVEGVFKAEGSLRFGDGNAYFYMGMAQSYGSRSRRSSMKFRLHGYWSESSGKLCMVGTGSTYSKHDNLLQLPVVLNLNNFKNSSIVTSLVGGSLQSLSSASDPNYFEPISVLMFPQKNYKYTLISEDSNDLCSGGSDSPLGLALNSQQGISFCSLFSSYIREFDLKYESSCNSSKNCTPFGGAVGYLPQAMSFNTFQCSEEQRKLQVLVEFAENRFVSYYQPFNPITTLVGEGSWDKKKNRLCIVACRILNTTDSWANASVGDCSMKLRLRFPAIWSIRDSSRVVGEIWSNKTVKEPGNFERIRFRTIDSSMQGFAGLKYEYTKLERANKTCSNPVKVKGKGEKYPDGFSYDMRFDMSVKSSKKRIGWGYSVPISVGDQIYEQYSYYSVSTVDSLSPFVSSDDDEESSSSNPLNISYKITITQHPGAKWGSGISVFNLSSNPYYGLEISAEGIYDAETGGLCMVGCRNILANDSTDCEILVKFQFPPYSGGNGGTIKGSIESTRKNSDPLYFDSLDLSATAFYRRAAARNVWRMDMEIIMVLITNTLVCVFVGLQLLYVKRHPDILPFMSILMLLVLTFSHMIPLLLNFEAMFMQSPNRKNVFLGTGGWLQVDEVFVRVITMLAFFLEFRLLQLTWSARHGEGKQKSLWAAEKKAVFVSLLLYISGACTTLLVNWSIINYHEHSFWKDIKSYGGLILDGFLLPQILLNMFGNSTEKSLSRAFYIGTTLVRLLPHAYDLYRAHSNYINNFDMSYIYADPGADFYSTVWDVVIPLVGFAFAVVVYLQQRFGGGCILPRRLRQTVVVYEKVPVVSEAELAEGPYA